MTINELSTKDIKLGKESKESAKFIDDIYETLKKHYIKQQRDWYINERFVRWEHWIVFNKTLNQVQQLPVADWEVRRTVNKIRTQVRGIKNFIKRNQPRWQVAPNDASDESLNEAISYNKILQNIYETRNFTTHITDVIVNSLKFSVGIMEGGLIKKEWKTILDFWTNDTFDVFFDPEATRIQNSRFVLKAVKKSITSIKNNKSYKIDWSLTPDNREWASDYKDRLEKEKFNKQTESKSLEDFESIILKELWLKTVDETWQTKIKVITTAGGQIIRVSDTPYRRLPFFIYNPEREPNSIYSDPWIKDLISLNKSLDKMASQVESYTQRMLGWKWLVKRWVEVSTITDKGAEIISYKGNVPPTQQSLQPLPSWPFSYISSLERWIEEFGGIREASLWRAPGSLQSGKGIEALQSSDAATVAEPVENLEIFLAEIWEFVLEVIADTQVTSENIVSWKENIKFIWNKTENKPSETIIVEPRRVRVSIVPELAYSEDAKKEIIFRLAEAQMIDQQTLLEYLNVSNIWDIIERVKMRKDEQFKQELTKQKAAHATNWEWPGDSADLADQENMQMMSGQEVPPTPQALWTPEHTQLHIAFMDENNTQMAPDVKTLFENHITLEEGYQSWGQQPQWQVAQ